MPAAVAVPALPAAAPTPPVAVAPAAPPAPDSSADYAVFARKGSNSVRYVNTLDGGRRLASAEELARNGYSVCVLTNPELKKTLPGIDPELVTLDQVERVILGQRQVRRNLLSCVNNGNFVLGSRPDLVVTPRQYLRAIRSSTPSFAEYDEIGEVKFSVLAQASQRVVQAQDERRRTEQSWAAEVDALAASGSKEKMGSLTLSALRLSAAPSAERPSAAALRSSRNVRICALEYSGADRQAVLGYGYRRWRGYSQAFQANAEAAGLTIHPDNPITKGYASIEEIYTAYQQDPEACQIVVDFSRNLKLLMAAMMILVIVVGTAMDMTPTILILTPVLMPIVKAAGIDPVYFGVLFIINNAIGLITPPVGTVLNTVAGVGKISMDAVTKGVWPFMLAQLAVLFLLVLFPELVMVPARWLYN